MLEPIRVLFQTLLHAARDLVTLTSLAMPSRAQLAADNLFLESSLSSPWQSGLPPLQGCLAS